MSMSPGGPSGGPPNPPLGSRGPSALSGRHPFNQSLIGSSAASSAADAFTSEMRDRQARGKDPYGSGDDDGDLNGGESGATPLRLGRGRAEKEDFGSIERRQKAVAFLDSPELLMMYAQSTGVSIAAARLHFMKLLCGYDDETLASTTTSHSASLQSRLSHSNRSADRRGGPLDRRAGAN